MTSKSETELHAIWEKSIKEFDQIVKVEHEQRKLAVRDRMFYSVEAAQWSGGIGEQFANMPKFQVNKILQSIIRIFNEYRNNRISPNFTPKDKNPQKDIGDILAGLYRADEQDSCAQEAYDNAFEEGVGGGMGAFRFRADLEDEYADDEDEKQSIKIEPIFDADNRLYFNLGAIRQDKSDAKRAWLLTSYTHEEYKAEFNDDPTSWPKDRFYQNFDWLTPDLVYVAEYYVIEDYSYVVHVFRGLSKDEISVNDDELTEEKAQELADTGYHEVRQNKRKSRKVHKYLMSGSGILRDKGYIAGKNIPFAPFYAKRWYINGVEHFMGHVRPAIDLQRLLNMIISKAGHVASMNSVEVPIFLPEQIQGHGEAWANADVNQSKYLLVNAIKDASGQKIPSAPVAYTKPPAIPEALAMLYQILGNDIQEVLGSASANEEVVSNISARAVELIHNRLDMQAFIYTDNFAKTVKRGSEIWLSMKKDISVNPRKVKTIGNQGESDYVDIMKPVIDKETGKQTLENDLSKCDCDVAVDVGASFSSRKEATARGLMNLLPMVQNDQQMSSLMVNSIIMNMEGEGLTDLSDFSRRKLVLAGVIKPTKEEEQQMNEASKNQQPDPQAQLLISTAKQAEASAEKDIALAAKAKADAANAAVKAQEIIQKLKGEHPDQVLEIIQALNSQALPQ